MTGLQVTGHFHRYGHVGSTEMGGAKHFERPWVHSCARRVGFCLIAGAHSKEKIEEES